MAAYKPIEIPEPDLDVGPPETVLGYPASQHTIEHTDGVTYFLGRGNRKRPDVMFVAPCPLEEELDSRFSPAMLLKGSPGALFERSARRAGIDVKSQYYTTLCKYALPRNKKLKPDKDDIARCAPLFERELKQRKPRVVVCLGKQVFDYFYNLKFNETEIMGGWFEAPSHSIQMPTGKWIEAEDDDTQVMETYECYRDFHLFVMGPTHLAVSKPEVLEGQAYDLFEVRRHLDLSDELTEKVHTDYQLLDSLEKVEVWADLMLADKRNLFSVDCEWAGEDYLTGELRSVQMCWAEGRAACLQFFNEHHEYTFTDKERARVLELFQRVMNRDEVRFIGHNFSADYLWLKHHLGVDPYKRCVFDTMYAMHTVDESYDLKLERLAIRFTDLGRYDIPLLVWKKENKEKMTKDGGYGAVPTDILFPYSCLQEGSLVQLADGSWKPIKQLVDTKYSGEVRALLNGKVVNRRVTNWHKAAVGQKEWYKLITPSTPSGKHGVLGPSFTPDHKVLTQRGKVRVDQLKLGEDKIATDTFELSDEQLSVVIASLLADGGFTYRNKNGVGFHFSQCARRKSYADWKAEALRNMSPKLKYDGVGRRYECPFNRYWKYLWNKYPRKTEVFDNKLKITPEVLERLGPLGLAVWYQDDGCYTKYKQIRISARTVDAEERRLVIDWLSKLVGPYVGYYESQGVFYINRGGHEKFMDLVTPYMCPVFGYKTDRDISQNDVKIKQGKKLFYEEVIALTKGRYRSRRRAKDGVRYCLSVEEAENFLTKAGFVSNCADVDVPFRAYPKLTKLLVEDETFEFYHKIKLRYVTDGFAHMTEAGVPLDAEDAKRVRKNYNMIRQLMLDVFRHRVRESADTWLLSTLFTRLDPVRAQEVYRDTIDRGTYGHLKEVLEARAFAELKPKLDHWQDARDFNPNSADQKRRWLFDYKELEPIKSTATDEGPSISWEKVLEQPPGRQKNYRPSVDKDVLQVYAQQDDDCQLLVEQLAVAQVTKNFLKGEDTGLEGALREDGCLHSSYLATESNRPRSTRPNLLNLPGYLNKRAERGVERARKFLCERYATDNVQEGYKAYLDEYDAEERAEMPEQFEELVPVRWCFKAPPGRCFVDADYATAEVKALAALSFDKDLIAVLTEPDPQFVLVKDSEEDDPYPLRVAYVEGITQFTEDEWDPELVHTLEELGDRVVRDEHEQPVHPKRDVHWELAEHEKLNNKPREKLTKKLHRDGMGKVGNFSVAYSASPGLLARMVEVNTGTKLTVEEGQQIIDAYAATKPRAWEYLHELQELPGTTGFYQCVSGSKRHFKTLQGMDGVSKWKKDSVLKGQMREAANIAFQGIVGVTLARAVVWLIDAFREEGLDASVVIPLYDALYIVSRVEDVPRVKELMQRYMSDENTWETPGGTLKFDLDFAVTKRWSVPPTEEEKKELKL